MGIHLDWPGKEEMMTMSSSSGILQELYSKNNATRKRGGSGFAREKLRILFERFPEEKLY